MARKPRRIPPAQARADYWEGEIARAPSGRAKLDAFLDQLRAELKHMERTRPQEVDALRAHLARKWGPDVRALSKTAVPAGERTDGPVRPARRTRPLLPVDNKRKVSAHETIPRPEGPLRHLRGGQRFPGGQS